MLRLKDTTTTTITIIKRETDNEIEIHTLKRAFPFNQYHCIESIGVQ